MATNLPSSLLDGTVESNKELIKEFPFLLPRDRYSGRVPRDYDYSYTKLDEMPRGWRKRLGLKLCAALKKRLIKENALDRFAIEDIKEEYGAMKVYTYGSTRSIERLLIPSYEKMTERICCVCGENATKVSIVWTVPLCDKCANSSRPNSYVDIDYFYEGVNE